MKTLAMTMMILFAATSLLACEDDPAPEPVESAEATDEAATDEAATDEDEPEEEISEEELPIAEDFADEAEEAINADNYASELDSLAAEIQGDLATGGDGE